MPTGEVRELRALLTRRQEALLSERTRWLLRARSFLEAAGYTPARGRRSVAMVIKSAVLRPGGMDETLVQSLQLCERMHASTSLELMRLDVTLRQRAKQTEILARLTASSAR